MRLIDADKLKLCYTGTNGLDDKAEYFSIRKMIDLQLTAYDVDKVVEQLKKSSTDDDGIVCYVDKKPVIAKELAVKIVKSGGIE